MRKRLAFFRKSCIMSVKKQRGLRMNENLIRDLDEYFAKKYENYDLIAGVKSYESVTMAMILKNQNRIEQGEIASNEMRKIYYQPQAAQVLAEVKEKYVDNNFSFSVRVAPVRMRWRAVFQKKETPAAAIVRVIEKNGFSPQNFAGEIGYNEKTWKGILKGKYLPEKNLIYKIALAVGASQEDVNAMLARCEYAFDFADARDVIVRFLLDYRIYNPEMIEAAFAAYKIAPLLP